MHFINISFLWRVFSVSGVCRYQFSAMAAAGDVSGFYTNLMAVVRVSDTGCDGPYHPPAIMWPLHGLFNNIVVSAIETSTGEVLIPADHWGT